MGCPLRDIGGAHRPPMAKRLNDGARRASWGDQMLGRCVSQVDHPFAQHDAPGRSIGQIGALCRYLSREAQGVRRASACNLHLRSSLASQCLRDIIWSGRKQAELRMDLGEVVQASG